MATKKGGLGRGLDSLFSENTDENGVQVLRLSEIEPNKGQPRKNFDDAALRDLSESIRQHGLLQPLLVRPIEGGRYQIVAGERRWRACRMAGLQTVPVLIRELDNQKTMEVALIENLQREDLDPIEEAEGYRSLSDEYGLTQEEIADSVGKSRSAIANTIRLLGLSEPEKALLRDGTMSAGHARAMLSITDIDKREVAIELIKNGASVREIEQLAKSDTPSKPRKERSRPHIYDEIELAVKETIGRKVRVSGNGKIGVLHIEFYNDDELVDLANKITKI